MDRLYKTKAILVIMIVLLVIMIGLSVKGIMIAANYNGVKMNGRDVPTEMVDSFTYKGHLYYRFGQEHVGIAHSPECPKCFQIFD